MQRWIVWGLAAAFVILNYAQQVFPDIVAPNLTKDLHASKSTLGDIAAAYFIAYATLQIPIGIALDRFGTRIPLALALLVASIGSFLFSSAQSAESAILARFIMGASAAFSFLGCLKLIQSWFPVSKFSTMAGLTETAGMLGAASGVPIALLVSAVGWRQSSMFIGLSELIIGVLIFILVRDRPPSVLPDGQEISETVSTSREATSFLKNPQVWLNATYAASISLVIGAFGDLWGESFIKKSYGIDAVQAADVGAFLFLGGIAGSLFFGWFADYLGSRKKAMILGAIGGSLTIIPTLMFTGLPLAAFKSGLFLLGFFTGASIVPYAVARELYPRISGLSIGFLNTFYYVGSAMSQPLLGYMLGYHAQGGNTGKLGALTVGDYHFAFMPLIILMIVGLITSFIIKETCVNK